MMKKNSGRSVLSDVLYVLMRKPILVPLAFTVTFLVGLIMFPQNFPGVFLSAVIAAVCFLLPRIPPDDMHIKP